MTKTHRIAAAICVQALILGCAHSVPTRATAPEDPLAEAPADDLFQRAVELRRAGDFVRAEQYLAAARQRGYAEGKVIHELIGVCVDASRYQVALRYAGPYLTRHPEDWPLRYLVGALYLATGEDARARAELERVTAEKPKVPGPHYLLALTYSERLDRPRDATASFETYLALAPNGEHATEARAWLSRQAPVSSAADEEKHVEGAP